MSDIADEVDSIIEERIAMIKRLKETIPLPKSENINYKLAIEKNEQIEKIAYNAINNFKSFTKTQSFYFHKEILNSISSKVNFCTDYVDDLYFKKKYGKEIEYCLEKLINFYLKDFELYKTAIESKHIKGKTKIVYKIKLGNILNNIGSSCLRFAKLEKKSEKIYYYKLAYKMFDESINYLKECFENGKEFFSENESKKTRSKLLNTLNFAGEGVIVPTLEGFVGEIIPVAIYGAIGMVLLFVAGIINDKIVLHKFSVRESAP